MKNIKFALKQFLSGHRRMDPAFIINRDKLPYHPAVIVWGDEMSGTYHKYPPVAHLHKVCSAPGTCVSPYIDGILPGPSVIGAGK